MVTKAGKTSGNKAGKKASNNAGKKPGTARGAGAGARSVLAGGAATAVPSGAPPGDARPGSHPTRERLIDVTMQLMDADGHDAVTSDRVLQVSGISKGSLYHHFADFAELLEVAMARQFARSVDWNIASISDVMAKARSSDEMFQLIVGLFRLTHVPERAKYRLRRAMLAGMTTGNPRFQQALAREQDRLTDAMTQLFRQAQSRGWATSEVDPHAAAVLVQAYTLGLVVDDVSSRHVELEAWYALIERLLLKVFR